MPKYGRNTLYMQTNKKKIKIVQDPKETLSLKYSIRISGSVTSLSLRKNIVGLWLTLNEEDAIEFDSNIKGKLNGVVQNFIYKCLSDWKRHDARGFSDFVSEMSQKLLDIGAPGLHFYSMNQSEATLRIWNNIKK